MRPALEGENHTKLKTWMPLLSLLFYQPLCYPHEEYESKGNSSCEFAQDSLPKGHEMAMEDKKKRKRDKTKH